MKAKDKRAKYRAMSVAELDKKVVDLKEELFNLRFQSATGQLENTARLKAVKHDIARMYTILRERELGISQAPEATETKAEEK